MIEFVLPFEPPSTNNLFYTQGRVRIKSKKYKDFQKESGFYIQEWYIEPPLAIKISIFTNFMTKRGDYKIKDLDNYSKAVIDTVFKYTELDDKVVTSIFMTKNQSDEKRTEIKIFEDTKFFNR